MRYLLLLLSVVVAVHADEPPVAPPAHWAAEQLTIWRANGIDISTPLPDVTVATWPSGQRLYLQELPAEPLTRSDWRDAALSESYPNARRPLTRLARGAMLYDSYPKRLAKASGRTWIEELRDILPTMKSLNMNCFQSVTYVTPEEWPTLEEVLREADVQMVVQYHDAMFKPKRGRTHFYNLQVPKAVALARVCEGSPQLLGFSVREEVYYKDMFWLQEYHSRLLQECPSLPLYCLYHQGEAAAGSTEPVVHILGTDPYAFLGGYYAGGRQMPDFLTPQSALTGLLRRRLGSFAQSAMRKGAVFTYTMSMQPTMLLYTDDEMRAENIPLKEFPGVTQLENGRWLLWRHYETPANAIRAAIWLSASMGAQGWFPWYYTPKMPNAPEVPDHPEDVRTYLHAVNSSREGAENTRIWQEYADAMADMHELEPWLLNLRADGFPRFATEDKYLIGGVLRPVSGDGHAVMLVNCDVGRWEGFPRRNMDKKTASLDVDRHGRLTGYEPLTEPRAVQFRLRLGNDERVWHLPEGDNLEAVAVNDGSWHELSASLDPGRGQLLFVGTAAQFDEFRQMSKSEAK